MLSHKIAKLIRQYAKIVGIKNPELIKRVFMRGDIHQKKRDLIAMRATIYAKQHIRPGMSNEEQQKIMDDFTKTENLNDVHWPKLKINEKDTQKN